MAGMEDTRENARRLLKKLKTASDAKAVDTALEARSSAPKRSENRLLGEKAKTFLEQKQMFQRLGLPSPFFSLHSGVSADTINVAGRSLINFSGYNYLGLAGEDDVIAAAQSAVAQYGTSCSASRVAAGEIPLHRALEAELAAFLGTEDALVFNSGYGTNVGVIGHIMAPGDVIFHDELIHNSALVGAMLAGARRITFRHNDVSHLEALLHANRSLFDRALIVIEGVYSMDGDFPPLPDFVDLKRRFDTLLMVDEAHSLGVLGATGRGLTEHYSIDADHVDIMMGTLSKTLASCGGYIAGTQALIEYMKYTSPSFVYSCGLSPADTGAALAALRRLKQEPWRVGQLRANEAVFSSRARAAGLNTGASGGTGVVPVIVGSSEYALKVAARLEEQNIEVKPVFYPTVEENRARLRFFLTAIHQPDQIADTVSATAHALRAIAGPRQQLSGAHTQG